MKRRETFRWLKMKKYAIYFQVHCTKDKEHIWSAEWGYSAIFSSFSSASAAVCLLFTGVQPKADTGHKMQTVSVVFSTLHC